MAAYENEGYCPNNAFIRFEMDGGKPNALSSKIRKVLGDRTGYMVYGKNDCAYDNYTCSIVDATLGGDDGVLGMEIACTLRSLAPVCNYGDANTKLKIVLKDVINPYQLDDAIAHFEPDGYDCTEWAFYVNGSANRDHPINCLNGKTLLSDDRFVVLIDGTQAESGLINIGLFRLPQKTQVAIIIDGFDDEDDEIDDGSDDFDKTEPDSNEKAFK